MCTYGGVQCGGFVAMATRGYLQLVVENQGYLPADYTVSVTGCPDSVLPVQASHGRSRAFAAQGGRAQVAAPPRRPAAGSWPSVAHH